MDKEFNFYFMEMNTRLQVEHPVTEMITGTDLVEWQLRAAAGEKLPVTQEELKLNGWSFEARIYAEDPNNKFMPGAGPLDYFATPAPSEHIRIETGVRQNDEVSVHYDPMIAKLVVWGPDRNSALLKLRSCLAEFNVAGLSTNINFLMDLASHPEFIKGNVDTEFIPRHYDSLFKDRTPTSLKISEAVLALILTENKKNAISSDPFFSLTGARLNHSLLRTVNLVHDGKQVPATVISQGGGKYTVTVNGEEHNIEGKLVEKPETNHEELVCSNLSKGTISKQRVLVTKEGVTLYTSTGSYEFSLPLPKFLSMNMSVAGLGDAVAPMPGVIEKVMVEDGATVTAGDPLVVMIAMKMEYVIKAPKTGTVKKVSHKVGDFVAKNKACNVHRR